MLKQDEHLSRSPKTAETTNTPGGELPEDKLSHAEQLSSQQGAANEESMTAAGEAAEGLEDVQQSLQAMIEPGVLGENADSPRAHVGRGNSSKNPNSASCQETGSSTEKTSEGETAAAQQAAESAAAALDIWRGTTGPGETAAAAAGHENEEHQLRHGGYMKKDPGGEGRPDMSPVPKAAADNDGPTVVDSDCSGDSTDTESAASFLSGGQKQQVRKATGTCRDAECPYNKWLYRQQQYPSRVDVERWEKHAHNFVAAKKPPLDNEHDGGKPALQEVTLPIESHATMNCSKQLEGWGGPKSLLAPPYPTLGVFSSARDAQPKKKSWRLANLLFGSQVCTSGAGSTCSCRSCSSSIELPDDPSAPHAFTVNNRPQAGKGRSRLWCGHICCIVTTFIVLTLVILAVLLLYLHFCTKVMTRGMEVS